MKVCQYCDERGVEVSVNYMSKEKPQFADMCSECAENFDLEKLPILNQRGIDNE